MIRVRVIAPESKRIAVKLAGSMFEAPRAKRHRIELAAKATSARLAVAATKNGCDQRFFINFVDVLLCIVAVPRASIQLFVHGKLWVNIGGLE